jgi:hypothetical protein
VVIDSQKMNGFQRRKPDQLVHQIVDYRPAGDRQQGLGKIFRQRLPARGEAGAEQNGDHEHSIPAAVL